MRNSEAPQSQEEDGLLRGEEGPDDEYLVEEDYLEETFSEPLAGTSRPSRRDDRETLEGAEQAAVPDSTEEGKTGEPDECRGPANEWSSEGGKMHRTGVSPGVHDTENCPSPVSRVKLNEKDTPRVMLNESRALSGRKDTEFRPEEKQGLNTGRREGDFHPSFATLSRAPTMSNGGDRDQLLSAGGARTPIFLTDRGTKPLNTNCSSYPQPPSSASPVNEEEGNARKSGHTSASSAGRLALFDSLDNGPKIREGFDRLTTLLASLDEKVEKLVGDHERDFLLAYRTHMYAIQQQMEYFKRKADEEQAKILRDMKVRSLEKELSWFMSEALRLDGLCKHYQSNLEKWRARAEALAEDRNFLETQIKSCKRQSRALQARVDDLQRGAPDGESLNKVSLKKASVLEETPGDKGRTCDNHNKKSIESTRSSLRQVAPKVSCASGISDLSAEALRIQNERLRSELDRMRKQHKQLLSLHQTQMLSCKGEYEGFFVKCCNEVRREIQNRRVRALRASGSPPSINREVDSNVLNEDCLREPSLQDFLQADRRRLLELLVSNDELLGHLHALIFAPQGSASPSPTAQECREDQSYGQKREVLPGEEGTFTGEESEKMPR